MLEFYLLVSEFIQRKDQLSFWQTKATFYLRKIKTIKTKYSTETDRFVTAIIDSEDEQLTLKTYRSDAQVYHDDFLETFLDGNNFRSIRGNAITKTIYPRSVRTFVSNDKVPEIKTITRIKFQYPFNKSIDDLPDTISKLVLPQKYSQHIIKFPRYLRQIKIDFGTNITCHLPDSLRVLICKSNFEGQFPSKLRKAYFFENHPKYIPETVTHLRLTHAETIIPEGIKYLILGRSYSFVVNQLNNLKELTHLILEMNYSQIFNPFNLLIPSLKYVKLPSDYDHPITKIPHNIKSIDFGFNYCLPINMSDTIECIKYPAVYLNPITSYPANVKKIYYSNQFDEDIGILPSSVKYVKFGVRFNSSLSGLPSGLEVLKLGKEFKGSLEILHSLNKLRWLTSYCTVLYLPPKLETAYLLSNSQGLVNYDYKTFKDIPINIPKTLKTLKMNTYIKKHIPETVTHLIINIRI